MSSTVIPLLSMAATWLTVDAQRLPAILFITASSLPTLALAWWMFAMTIIVGGVIMSYRKYARDNSFDFNTFPAPRPRNTKRSLPNDRAVEFDAPHDLPKVSVLRPLKGLDCNIESNLLSSFRQDYPVTHVELIFCVADGTDPVIPVVQSLISRHPHHNARLVVGDVNIGVNPKINNLIRGYESAANDIVWIVDSNIWVAPGTLTRSIRALMAPGIGLVHHLPVGVQPTSLGSELEMLFLNSVHARAYLAINQLGPSSCVIGKSTLFRRSDLQICGGLRAFGKYMAEDNMIGQAIWDLGLRHAMTADRAWQPLGSMGTMDFFNRRQRWGRIRKFIVRAATLAEPLSECVLLSAFFAYAMQHFSNQWFSASFATPRFSFLYLSHACAWMLMDYWVSINVTHAAHLSFPRFARAWIIREISCLPTYVWAMSGSTVSWRNFHYQLQPGGTVQLVSLPCDQCGRSRLSLHGYSGHHVCTSTKPGNNSPPAAMTQARTPSRSSLLARVSNSPSHDLSWINSQRVSSQIQHWLRPLLLQQFGSAPSKTTPATRKRLPSVTLVVLPSVSNHSSFDVPLLKAPVASSAGFPIQRGRTPSISGI